MFAKRTNWNLETNRLSEALAAHRAAGKPLVDLTISNPTECGFHYGEAAILRALQNPEALKYEPNPRGLAVARSAVREYYAHRPGHGAVGIDDIFLTTSTSEAYSYVFRTLCDPQDEVLIPAPSYPLFEFLADIQDVRLVSYPLLYDHGWQIDFHDLEKAITPRTRAVIVVNPNNPTGNYCKAREMRQLHEICAKHSLAIIADEVFLDFSLNGDSHASFVRSEPVDAAVMDSNELQGRPGSGEEARAAFADALTFTLSGISKICGLPQMKAAWIVIGGPESLTAQAAARLEVIADTYLSINAPIQWALPTLLELRHGFQSQLLDRVRANLAELDRQLTQRRTVDRLEVQGGWNVVLRVPATRSDEELALDLLSAKGVYVHPGHFYDFESDGYLVLSLIAESRNFASGVAELLSIF
jgi:alanine-synthesizing transaminase